MAKNIVDKIWNEHVVAQKKGHPAIFAIDLMMVHEVTSAQAFDVIRARGIDVYNRGKLLATVDHSIPTSQTRLQIVDDACRNQVETLRKNVEQFDVPFYDFGSGNQGIVHVIGPELGATQPGLTIVCGDSHTSTHGAFGALAFGVGTSEVGHVMASGCLLQRKPKTMKVEFKGQFQPGVFSKDAILKLISEIGVGGATGHVVEYCGEAVRAMSMEERMTVCNMSIECGARAGLISPDQTTFDYIKGKRFAPKSEDWQRAVDYWSSLASDSGAKYDQEIVIDVDQLKPMVTWGINPGQGVEIDQSLPVAGDFANGQVQGFERALDYTGLKAGAAIAGTPIEWAFVGSCTNGRIEDLRLVAEVLRGQKISEGVTMYIVPGSEEVREIAVKEGLDKVFKEAGADFRMPGCSMCLGMNDDKVPAGARCISSSNRNFMGRQGPGSITHLASPATVAASAIAGKIISGQQYFSN